MRVGVDLDGTIITCRQKHCVLMTTIMNAYDLTFSESKYWNCKTSGMNNIQALQFQGFEYKLAKKISLDWISKIENVEWSIFDRILNDFFMQLVEIKKQGHSVHLISARNHVPNAYLQLHTLGLESLFDSIDFVDQRLRKRKSYFFLKRCVDIYIGDTELDLAESKEAKISFYPVSTGMRSNKFFIDLKLEHIVNMRLNEIIEKESHD